MDTLYCIFGENSISFFPELLHPETSPKRTHSANTANNEGQWQVFLRNLISSSPYAGEMLVTSKATITGTPSYDKHRFLLPSEYKIFWK